MVIGCFIILQGQWFTVEGTESLGGGKAVNTQVTWSPFWICTVCPIWFSWFLTNLLQLPCCYLQSDHSGEVKVWPPELCAVVLWGPLAEPRRDKSQSLLTQWWQAGVTQLTCSLHAWWPHLVAFLPLSWSCERYSHENPFPFVQTHRLTWPLSCPPPTPRIALQAWGLTFPNLTMHASRKGQFSAWWEHQVQYAKVVLSFGLMPQFAVINTVI